MTTDPLFTILGWVLFIIGIFLLFASGLSARHSSRLYTYWESVQGIVVAINTRTLSPGNPHCYPVVEFQDTLGRKIQFESKLGFYPARHQIGQAVAVLYPLQTPEKAILETTVAKWTLPLALMLFGALFLILGLLLLTLV